MKLSTRFLLAFLLVVSFNISNAPAADKDSKLLDELMRLEAAHPGLCSSMMDAAAARAEISRLADEAREQLTHPPIPSGSVEAVNRIVFGPAGLRASQDLHDPCNLFLSSVLARKQGYCVGVAAVYLAVAADLDLPIHAVSTPSHVFLRYDDGKTRINIETFNGQAPTADEQYIAQYRVAPDSIRKGVFLEALSTGRFLAQVHNNLGVIYSERKNFERAAGEYRTALELDHRLPAAWYNLAKDLQTQGRLKEAVRAFAKALRLHPNDTWALNNRAIAYRDLGEVSKAKRDLEEALHIDPAFEQARATRASLEGPP